MIKHTRVVIVGGGIYGCGLLMQLVEKGWNDVTLLEKNELTAGSTWHAAGFCTHYSFNLTHVFMRKFSTDLYQRLEQEGITATGYHRCCGLRLTHDPDRMDEFRHGASVGRQLGIDFEVIGPREIQEIFPMMDTKGLLGAVFEPTDGYVDPAQATNAMANIARQGGATILRQNPVQSIEQLASGEWRLTTPTEQVIAQHVVIAAGFWANQVGKMMGLDLPITPMLHQYLVTEDHPDVIACNPDSIPLVRHHDYQWYTRRERGGMVLGAYESNPQTWSIDGVPPEFGMELMEPDLDRVAHLMADAMERIPALAKAGIKTNVHGPVSYSADGQPLIGPAPGLRNAWLACGSGFGIGEGAGAGKLLAEWMVEGQPPMHMGAFDPRRFGAYADRSYRVEKAIEVFAMQFATHYPLEERQAARQKKTTPIYDRLKQAGARFGVAFGWERANWFALGDEVHTLSYKRTEWFDAVARECSGVTENAGVIDLSGFSKYRVGGVDARSFLNSLSANRIPSKRGDIRLCHFLNKNGRVECEFTVTCIGDQQFYLNCAATAELHHLDWLKMHLNKKADVQIENLTASWGVLGISGPNARKLLQSHCSAGLSNENFPWLTAKPVEVEGIELLAMRVSYTGELGWELHHPIADQSTIYDALKAGVGGTAPIDFGFYGLNAMRMEKAYKAWGIEMTIENSAWELGLEKFVEMDNRDFIGRQALIEQKQTGWKKQLYYVELEPGSSDAIGGEAVLDGDKLVGVMVSGAYGHRAGKNLGFAIIDRDSVSKDVKLEAELIGARRKISILQQPAFDPQSVRVKQ